MSAKSNITSNLRLLFISSKVGCPFSLAKMYINSLVNFSIISVSFNRFTIALRPRQSFCFKIARITCSGKICFEPNFLASS